MATLDTLIACLQDWQRVGHGAAQVTFVNAEGTARLDDPTSEVMDEGYGILTVGDVVITLVPVAEDEEESEVDPLMGEFALDIWDESLTGQPGIYEARMGSLVDRYADVPNESRNLGPLCGDFSQPGEFDGCGHESCWNLSPLAGPVGWYLGTPEFDSAREDQVTRVPVYDRSDINLGFLAR